MAWRILDGFDRLYFMNEEIFFSAYPNRRQPVTEENRNVIRRRLLIEIHFYEMRGETQ